MIVLRFKGGAYDELYVGLSNLEGKFTHHSKGMAIRFKSLKDAHFVVKDWVRNVWPSNTIEEVYEPEEVES